MDHGKNARTLVILAALAVLAGVILLNMHVRNAVTWAEGLSILAMLAMLLGVSQSAHASASGRRTITTLCDELEQLRAHRPNDGALVALGASSDELLDSHKRLVSSIENHDNYIDEIQMSSKGLTSCASLVNSSAKDLAQNIGSSSASIEETLASIRSVSDSIGGLADTVNSVSSAIGELAASISMVANNAGEAATLSQNADVKARDGGKAVERLVDSTREIAADIGSVVGRMSELGEASAKIGSIIEVIDNIADQTNLLALNAAIEAARAGEHGRGFAVVADEIRKLAENSASSTRQIADLVKDIQAKTVEVVKSTSASGGKATTGFQMADMAGQAIKEILNSVSAASKLIEQISAAAKEQASASANIVRSVEQMNQLMQSAARSLDEQNLAGSQIMTTIVDMQHLTQSLNAAVDQQSAATKAINDAIREAIVATNATKDASAGIEAAASVVRERVHQLEKDLSDGPSRLAPRADDVFARLGSG